MRLISETIEQTEFITEDTLEGKNHYLSGIFMQSEKLNKNGRMYPKELLEREVGRYNRDYIRTNRAFGEMNHPDKPSINLDRVSHLVTELYPDGNDFIGKAKILNTPTGNIIKGIIEGGGQLGVSTRGVGSLKNVGGTQQVQPDFKLICVDVVSDPSAPQAFVNGIMEGKEWIYANGNWTEQEYELAKKVIKEVSIEDIETVSLALFEDFISKL